MSPITKVLGIEVLGGSINETVISLQPYYFEYMNSRRQTSINAIHCFFLLPCNNSKLTTNHISSCVNAFVRASCTIPTILDISPIQLATHLNKPILIKEVGIGDTTSLM